MNYHVEILTADSELESVEVDTVANNHIEESTPKAPLMTNPSSSIGIMSYFCELLRRYMT
ncbi:hypothetical protein SO802_018489 [Lithocarpus litseifolius]|uniref:Uncharacterized protein n=1 Tax=Lithocarpus litseifolius TaxID=425828 RepID=A0AAW2CLE2_9ROSI